MSQYEGAGGLLIFNGGTAMLTDVNVYSNKADRVRSLVALTYRHCYNHPLELTVARVLDFGVAGGECLAF